MNKGPSLRIRLTVYPIVGAIFLMLCYVVGLYAWGYRLNLENGKIVKSETGIIILATRPGGASVFLDGKKQKSQTPTLGFMNMTVKGVSVGEHRVRVEKEGYETWEGSFKVEPSLVSWGNYIVLVPVKKQSKDFNFPGNVKQSLASVDKKILIIQSEDVETKTRHYFRVNLDSKEKTKIASEPMIEGQVVRLREVSSDNNRLLLEKSLAGKTENWVFEIKADGLSWNVSILFNLPFTKVSFSPNSSAKLYTQKDSDIHLVDYEQKTMSAVLVRNAVNFFRNSTSIFFVKKELDNYSLSELTRDGTERTIIKSVPASDSYLFEHLDRNKTFVLLPQKTKELILYQTDSNEKLNSKILAQEVVSFTISPNKKRILYRTANEISVYDLDKNKFYKTVTADGLRHADWFNDESNLLYIAADNLYFVNYNGSYNKRLFSVSPNFSAHSLPGSENVYFGKLKAEKNDLSVFSFSL